MDVVVAMTAHDRPDYLRTVLQSWAVANESYGLPFIFQVEPVSEEVLMACSGWGRVNLNPEVYGPLGNPWHALNAGFETGADFVVLAEDDSVVAPDALDYFAWAAERYERERDVLAVCSFTRWSNGYPDLVFRRSWFASVVWGTWRDRWDEYMRGDWGWTEEAKPWDVRFARDVATSERVCVFPCISRSQHIGVVGAHVNAETFASQQADEVYSGPRVQRFREVTR